MNANHFNARKLSSLAIQSRELSNPSLVSKIRDLVKQGHHLEALHLYTQTPSSSSKFTYPSLLKAIASIPNLNYGKSIHTHIVVSGFHSDPYTVTSLVNMYVKCGSLGDAVKVFDQITQREEDGVLVKDVSLWNSVIGGCFKFGFFNEGVARFRKMLGFGIRPDGYTACVLLGGGGLGCRIGKSLHGYVVRNMFGCDQYLESALIDMYLSCGEVVSARSLFSGLGDKSNVVLWNVMIVGLCENGLWKSSLELYSLMRSGNVGVVSTSITGALSASCHGEDLGFGCQVHSDVIKMGYQDDIFVGTSLLTMYAKSGSTRDAEKVFRHIRGKETELYNAMISAYISSGSVDGAIYAYIQMRKAGKSCDSFTVSNILSSCGMAELYDFARQVHAEVYKRPVQNNLTVQSALLTMYSKCGRDEDATSVFYAMREPDLVAWSSMLSGFCQNKKFRDGWYLFRKMGADGLKPDADVMTSIISACTGLENVELGCTVHGYVMKSGVEADIFVAASLIDMYAKCGLPFMARYVFDNMPQRNLVAWNSIISCYCRNGDPELCIDLFSKIREHGFHPDSVSMTSVLVAVSSMAALLKGKLVHGHIVRLGILFDPQVQNALIDMYIKCGSLKYAKSVFHNMHARDLVTWNLMISGYGSHGECSEAIRLFDQMKGPGTTPDDVTFLSLISSCSHNGMVKKGLALFRSMRDEYCIEPKMEHYVNIVDLFGRAGRLNDAYHFIQNMPVQPDRSIWLCLLGACRAHRNVELGELAAHNLLQMEPSRGSNYVQLLNLYGETGFQDKGASLRATMKEKGLKKSPGCSWIELRNRVDVFFSGDSSSLLTVEIHETLNNLKRIMKKIGDCKYVDIF